ncbi:MAG: tetratricopeptide repeat protein [Lachnospiraceae bacterium]|nr:tetratricopeptide repeat protein [Lachnospiraceae bacterium]
MILGRVCKTASYCAALIMGVTMLTGCSLGSSKELTATAISQIEELDYAAALDTLNEAEEAGEDPVMIARTRGIASLGLAQYEDALNSFTEVLSYSDWKVDELDFDTNYYLADTYEHMKDYEQAVETYSAILGLRDKDVVALYRRGCDYLLLGQHDPAVADFEKAIKYAPDNYDLRIEIAGRLSEASYESEGRKYLEDFLIEKEKKLSKFDKGRIYFYMEDYEDAKVYFEEARDDDDQNTILFLGKTYEMLGDYNYATSTYQNYLTRHPESAMIYNQLGLSRLKSGEYTGARDAFAAAGSIGGSGMDQILSYNEIVANEYMGDFSQAASLMQEYLRKYPDDADAQREDIFLSTR